MGSSALSWHFLPKYITVLRKHWAAGRVVRATQQILKFMIRPSSPVFAMCFLILWGMVGALPQGVAEEHDFQQPFQLLKEFWSLGLDIAEGVPKIPSRNDHHISLLFVHDTISQHNQWLWHFSGHGCFVFNARCWKRGASTNWSLFHFVRAKLDRNSWGTAWLINNGIQRTFKTHWDTFRTGSVIHRVVTLSLRFKAENAAAQSSWIAEHFLLGILRDSSRKATACTVIIVSLNRNNFCKAAVKKKKKWQCRLFSSP